MSEIRYCKKCGCELMSTNKKKLCENCRYTRNQKRKKAVMGIGGAAVGVFGIVLTGGKIGGINKK